MLAAITGATGLTLGAGTAHAAVTCGSTLNQTTTLTTDLNCQGTALFVGAPNIVVDLGGRTISGTQVPDDQPGTSGVHVISGRAGVTVRNGTIRGFNRGVTVNPGASNALITGLKLDRNALGIGVFGDPANAPSNTRILKNTVTDTTRFSAIQVAGRGHRIEGNTILRGGSGISVSGDDNVVQANTLTDTGFSGIALTRFPSFPGEGSRNQVLANTVHRPARSGFAAGIAVFRNADSVVRGNRVEGTSQSSGITIVDSARSRVSQNQLSGNGSGGGVLIRGTSTGTVVSANVAEANSTGVNLSDPTPTGTLVERNTVSASRFDGINVASPQTTLTGNTSYRNGGFGIRAVNGVTDGGGHRAFGNAAGQCTPNIAC